MTGTAWLVGLCLLAAGDVDSGPAVGEKPPKLEVAVIDATGTRKLTDLTAGREGKPTVYVFVQSDKWSRPMARFLKTLDTKLGTAVPGASSVAVWLAEDQRQAQDYLPKAQNSLKLERTSLNVYGGAGNAPDGWGINSDAHLTAVVVNEGKVAATFGYVSVNETVVEEVVQALGKP